MGSYHKEFEAHLMNQLTKSLEEEDCLQYFGFLSYFLRHIVLPKCDLINFAKWTRLELPNCIEEFQSLIHKEEDSVKSRLLHLLEKYYQVG